MLATPAATFDWLTSGAAGHARAIVFCGRSRLASSRPVHYSKDIDGLENPACGRQQRAGGEGQNQGRGSGYRVRSSYSQKHRRRLHRPAALPARLRLRAPGDQPQAIDKLVAGHRQGHPHQVLLGVTGSGKTFTMANVIAAVQRPTLVISHNKTLAAQLYSEFKSSSRRTPSSTSSATTTTTSPRPTSRRRDIYIEKDTSINEEIDKMRHSATHSLLERSDVIIVASVSCIYGLGSPEAYYGMLSAARRGKANAAGTRSSRKLVEIQYERNDIDFHRGTFRVRGDVVEIFPPYEEARAIRFELFDDVDRGALRDRPAAGQGHLVFGQGRHLSRQPLRDHRGDGLGWRWRVSR